MTEEYPSTGGMSTGDRGHDQDEKEGKKRDEDDV